ncbi:gag/pol protein [Cucumis melo var. makuwa]|uniref:Gag/pol protein n=1 Tax=Cucumis melo var. makuwa TaxID=1194695 RepID=A0A5A7V388_CUCMM|nr:gag/pol protein [Cucumis melo var. makuwa]TYK14691.1 gag/pol protein [Cucumis melo var. makuwa]
MSDVLAKKHESLATVKEIMDSLKGMFGEPEWSLRHEIIKYIYTKRMNEGTSVREHVLDMMMHFNIVERFYNLTKGKGKEVEANVATTKRKFKRGLSSKSKARPSKPNRNIEKKGKEKTPKQDKEKKNIEKGKCYHCGENGHWIGRLVKNGLLSQLEDNSLPPCDSYLEGKMTKRSFTRKGLRTKIPLELVHSNLCGPMNVKAREGYEYFSSFIDDYLRYGHVYLIQNKSDSFEKFKEYKAKVENESGKTIKTFQSDRGGEYMDLRCQDYLIKHGVLSQLSAPSTPQQNGVSERRNRTLLDMVRSMMSFARLPDSFWGYALETSIYILNNVPSKSVSKIPYELCKGRKAQIIIPDDGIEDPLTYKQAMNDVNCDQWIKVMDREMESMHSNSVWTRVDQPNDVKSIGCKWIYKRKRDQAGKVQTFKDRLVAKGHLVDIKKWLAMQFQMKDLGNAQHVLGIQIDRNHKNKTLAMSQIFYIDKMLSRYKMQNSKKDMLLYRYGIHLSKEQCPKTPQEVEDMGNIPYASAVGSLMYAMLCTRPDICYSVGIVSRYQSNPERDHWTVIKNILRYFRKTKDYILVHGSKDLILIGYIDSDFQTDKDARKSTSGSVFTLKGGAVVWRSIKQSYIIDSTMEAKYVTACEAAKEAV